MLELSSNIGFAAGSGAPNSQTLAGFNGVSYSATADILPTRQILVSRARQLDMTCPLASAAIDRMTGGIVGAGLAYAVSDTSEFFEDEFYRALTDELKRLLKRRSISRLFDAQRRLTFNQIQEMACRNWLLSGDVFFVRRQQPNGTFSWRAIESDRVMSPYYMFSPDSTENGMSFYALINPDTGNRIIDGIELDDDASPVAYWVVKDYIDKPLLITPEQIERIPSHDSDGLPVMIHLFKPTRPDQYRGVPLLSNVIETLHNTRNYAQAELQAAIFQSAVWGFFTSNNPTSDETMPLSDEFLDEKIPLNEEAVKEDLQLSPYTQARTNSIKSQLFPTAKVMSAGQFQHLADGEDVKFLQSTHPNNNFDAFMKSHNLSVSSSIGIPRQVLECSYDGTYASARGSVLEANRTFKSYRSYFIESFLKPLFEVFAYEVVDELGGFDDPLFVARALAIESVWQAPAALCLDPRAELEGARIAIEMGLIDADEAAQMIYGHKAKRGSNAENI